MYIDFGGAEEIYDAGIDECFGNGLTVIEWGEMIEEILPGKYLQILFEKIKDTDKRKVIIKLKENK